MNDNIDAVKSTLEAWEVADITNEITNTWIIVFFCHVMLFELVAAEDDDFLRPGFLEEKFNKVFAEKAGSSGDEHSFSLIGGVHVIWFYSRASVAERCVGKHATGSHLAIFL